MLKCLWRFLFNWCSLRNMGDMGALFGLVSYHDPLWRAYQRPQSKWIWQYPSKKLSIKFDLLLVGFQSTETDGFLSASAKQNMPRKNNKKPVSSDGRGGNLWKSRTVELTVEVNKVLSLDLACFCLPHLKVAVSNVFYFPPYLRKIPILTNIF